jgi:hypothetical protein
MKSNFINIFVILTKKKNKLEVFIFLTPSFFLINSFILFSVSRDRSLNVCLKNKRRIIKNKIMKYVFLLDFHILKFVIHPLNYLFPNTINRIKLDFNIQKLRLKINNYLTFIYQVSLI